MVLPILYAGVLCTVGYYFDVQGTTEPLKTPNLKGNGSLSLILAASLLAYIAFKTGWVALDMRALMLLFSLLAIRLAIALLKDGAKGIQWNKLIGLVKDVGVVAVLFGAAYVATFYATVSQLGDPRFMGPVISNGLSYILYGLIIYCVGVTLTLSKDPETVDWISRKNWHIAEAYAFVLFVTLAAQSIFAS
jgi:Zn-dependent protease